VLRYLARFFRVGVFGSDWSSVGIGGGGWVDYANQAAAYARGKVAINISQAGEEEGVSHKPFQIAAAGVPMVHIHRRGLDELFDVGREIEAFATPRQARDTVAALLNDPKRRTAMAAAARSRLERDHTWSNRLLTMFDRAGVSLDTFRAPMRHTAPVMAGG
jgi:spore maturation protein CgeB